MKYIILVTILLFSTCIVLADSPLGLTLRMSGDITLTRQDDENPLTEGESLYNEDSLRSFDDSFAFIKFIDDGATLRLFENTILTLNTEVEADRLNKSNYLQIGNVFTSVRADKGDLEIETPTTVASVKGTEGFVTVYDDGKTTVIVLKGSIEVYNKLSGETHTVTAGNSCDSDDAGNIDTYPTPEIDPDWIDAIEGASLDELDTFEIEMIREDGEKRTIEIEIE